MAESGWKACYEKYMLQHRAQHISEVTNNTNPVRPVTDELQASTGPGGTEDRDAPCVSACSSPPSGPALRDSSPRNDNASIRLSMALLPFKS